MDSIAMKRLLVGLTLAAGCAGSEAPTKTEILWDTWGVPHIYATNDVEAFKAFGYAQAAAHGNLVLKLYGEARGRASEYWGRPTSGPIGSSGPWGSPAGRPSGISR